MMRKLLSLTLLAALAACDSGSGPAATPSPTENAAPADGASPATASGAPAPASAPAGSAELDYGALQERKDPARVLAYFAQAVAQDRWDDAVRVWRKGDLDARELKELFGPHRGLSLGFGPGEQEGAAGSLYYGAPLTLTADGGSFTRKGTITLRRVNDVPGAEDWQLAWHVERIEWADAS